MKKEQDDTGVYILSALLIIAFVASLVYFQGLRQFFGIAVLFFVLAGLLGGN